MQKLKKHLALTLILALLANMAGCAVLTDARAADLMKNTSPNHVTGKPVDANFTESMADFSFALLKETAADTENCLISPLSVTLALAMTANGADGETLTQMESLLGGTIPLDALNEYLYTYTAGLPSADKAKLETANAIWFRDNGSRLHVEPDFLQANADYYHAAAYRAAFDSNTLREMNNWVKTNTDGMIDSILEKIEEHHVMYLINTIVFDAEWQTMYQAGNTRKGDFTDINGAVQSADFMHSTEGRYLDDGMATGFVKPYQGGGYSFVALLPNEDVSIETYLASLTGTAFLNTLKSAQEIVVYTAMPEFEHRYSIDLNDTLIALGMPDAFDGTRADFGRMGTSPEGPLYLSKVLHKTFIKVDERGTKAGAVSAATLAPSSAPPQSEPKIVRLDRPFVYAIIDNQTNLPIFLGTLMSFS